MLRVSALSRRFRSLNRRVSVSSAPESLSCGRSSHVFYHHRGIAYTPFNMKNPLDRILDKPVLIEEDTDDEFDDDMMPRKKTPLPNNPADDEDDYEDEDYEFEEIGEEFMPQIKVGKQLLKLGRVPYRSIENLPDWVTQRKEEISVHRTPQQIRRCVKNWMLKPDRDLQRKYAYRNLGWMPTAPSDASKEADRVMPYGPEETIAYVNYFFPSRYVITRRVFREIKTILPKYKPQRILDFGCGPGTAGAAAVDVWGRDVVRRYNGVDMSQSMLDAAKVMTTRMGLPYTHQDTHDKGRVTKQAVSGGAGVSVTLDSKTVDVVSRIAARGDDQRFDMAVSAYTLSELTSDAVKRAAVQVMYEALDVDGILVIIDNGNPVGSHHTRSARQMLLELFGSSGSSGAPQPVPTKDTAVRYVLQPPSHPRLKYEDFEVKVISPCTHDGVCPLRKGSWCSFSQRAHSAMIRKDSEEKFSYCVIQKRVKHSAIHRYSNDGMRSDNGQDDWVQSPEEAGADVRDPTPLVTLRRFMDNPGSDTSQLVEELIDEVDWDDYNPPLFREEYGRLIRSPIKAKQHVVMDVCQSDGHITRSTVSKGSAWKIPTFYSAVRKLRWGGLVPALPVDSPEVGLIKSNQEESEDEKTSSIHSVVTPSPLSRRRPTAYPPVRRDIVPPPPDSKKDKGLFAPGEGPQKRTDRNRFYRGDHEELLDYKRKNTDSDSDMALDSESDDDELRDLMSRIETVDDKGGSDEDDAVRAETAEEKRKLLGISDKDWKEWEDALEGNPLKGSLPAYVSKKFEEEDALEAEVPFTHSSFQKERNRRRTQDDFAEKLRNEGRDPFVEYLRKNQGTDDSDFGDNMKAQRQFDMSGKSRKEEMDKRQSHSGGGRRKPNVARAAAALKRKRE
mmetsp:Transcript_10422/g.15854  ORF Transcript_10422/g.15854 Transcript_10422/m.15854 type:complete len:895 (+) Transcript_10422:39-2723(+)